MDIDGQCAPTPSTSSIVCANDNTVDLISFESNFVMVVAEQLGIELPAQSGQMIAQEVSNLLRRIFKLARKFQRSGRRKWLTSEDLEVAMAFFGHTPIIGHEPLDNTTFRQTGDVFVREDQELELIPLINSSPPKLPLEATLKAHWLVITGTQPAIPENPLPPTPKDLALIQAGMETQGSNLHDTGGILLAQLAKTVRKTEQVQIKQMTTHALSLEQQVFFLKIMEAIMGQDEQKRIEALNCLQTDCSLRALLPRFSVAITEGVRCNIVVHNMAILVYLMRMIQALSQNAALSLEPCLHELLPAIMSCILSRQLSSNQQTSDTHCVLREFSADLLAQLLRRYQLPHIHTRVIRALSKAFNDSNCSLPTLYGAAFALCELGTEVIQRVVVPNVPVLCAAIHQIHSDKLYSHERSLGDRFYNKMVEKLTIFAKDPNCELQFRNFQEFFNNFGGFAEDIYKTFKSNGGQQLASSMSTINSSVAGRMHNTRRSCRILRNENR